MYAQDCSLLDDISSGTATFVVLWALRFSFGEVLDRGVTLNVEPVSDALIGGRVEGSDLDVAERKSRKYVSTQLTLRHITSSPLLFRLERFPSNLPFGLQVLAVTTPELYNIGCNAVQQR
jgi:hypothetical protein